MLGRVRRIYHKGAVALVGPEGVDPEEHCIFHRVEVVAQKLLVLGEVVVLPYVLTHPHGAFGIEAVGA